MRCYEVLFRTYVFLSVNANLGAKVLFRTVVDLSLNENLGEKVSSRYAML